MQHPDPKFMLMAIEKAKQGIALGQSPFGACIVKEGEVISCAHNTVWQSTDITAHAEVVAIRKACLKLNAVLLEGCIIYSTCEPCPMCFSAIHWARMPTICYGADIADAKAAGFNELDVSNETLKTAGKSPVTVIPHFLREENVALFDIWKAQAGQRPY